VRLECDSLRHLLGFNGVGHDHLSEDADACLDTPVLQTGQSAASRGLPLEPARPCVLLLLDILAGQPGIPSLLKFQSFAGSSQESTMTLPCSRLKFMSTSMTQCDDEKQQGSEMDLPCIHCASRVIPALVLCFKSGVAVNLNHQREHIFTMSSGCG
jgi:hypothetical protein